MQQFNLYDIFGYLIPGALVTGVLLLGLAPYLDIFVLGSFGGSLLLIVLCYLLGHVLHATTGQKLPSLNPSSKLLSSQNQCLSSEYKKRLIGALTTTFRPGPLDQTDLNLSEKEQQELFDFAYTLLIQKNVAGYVPLYNALYALYRGMLAGARWAAVLSAIFLSVHLIESLCHGRSDFSFQSVVWGVLLPAFVFLGWGKPLKNQFDDYAKRFAVSVYRNFWTWYISAARS